MSFPEVRVWKYLHKLYLYVQGKEHIDILPALIKILSEIGFLTDHLALPHEINENEKNRIEKNEKKLLKKNENENKSKIRDLSENYNNDTESIADEDDGESGR